MLGSGDSAAWASTDELEDASSLLMRFYNEIASDVQAGADAYYILVDRIDTGRGAPLSAAAWCGGYRAGIALRPGGWQRAMREPALSSFFIALQSDDRPGQTQPNARAQRAALTRIGNGALDVAAWWREELAADPSAGSAPSSPATVRRSGPKISPNAPCTCGSGKKYKRCCSPLRAV